MIPSIDTYLRDELEQKLKIILKNRYIIEEILKGVQEQTARNFIRAYHELGRDIPILYTMPQEKSDLRGCIYIGLREGEEDSPSIGSLEDTYGFKETGVMAEQSIIKRYEEEENRLYFELSHNIGELITIEGLIFAKSDDVVIKDNKIIFNYDPMLEGRGFVVKYVATVSEEDENTYGIKRSEQGLKKGFTTLEHYSILVLSTNMDVVRCLDLLVKAILIMMRNNPEEHNNLLLQRLQFGQIESIQTNPDESTKARPEILYGRETIVTYKVSYSLDMELDKLEEITFNLKTN